MKIITSITLIVCAAMGALGLSSIGNGVYNIRGNRHVLTVKGLAEKNITANYVTWNLSCAITKNKDHKLVKQEAMRIYHEILNFLKKHGIKDQEIIKRNPAIQADYEQIRDKDIIRQEDVPTFMGVVVITVQSERTKFIQSVFDKSGELLDKDILIDPHGPQFIIQNFDQFRDDMLEQAAESAMRVAQKICAKVGSRVIKMREADQGSIRILDPKTDESHTANQYMDQKLRVISTFVFETS